MNIDTASGLGALLFSLVFIVGMSVAPAWGKMPQRKDLGIVGQMAPELKVSKWINLPVGKDSFDIQDTKGKLTYLYFFQSWCPGCHEIGFPTLKKLTEEFAGDERVQFAAIQTTFEGYHVNTADKLEQNSERYKLGIPFGQSDGESGTPDIMRAYRTGGTPWVVIVGPDGRVLFNDFHVDPDKAEKAIAELSEKINADAKHDNRKKDSKEKLMTERAVLAGGCFWGMEDLIRKLPGVVSTRVGYTGGKIRNATYRNHGNHAEALEVIFEPTKTSYRDLLEFFFQVHDPTTKNRQGNDRGTSYRSAIFFTSDEQKKVALDTIADVNASGLWPGKVVTEVVSASEFWEAEPEHQDYLERNPNGYTCHFPRPNWVLPKRSSTNDK